jgi:16S rRNA (adenine1518-N6/adenine1519-N6)-dimethyltransferase
VQTLTQIKAMLALHGLHPKKRYGQNFLHDQNQVRRIVEAAAVGPGDVVLEVGPGTGALSVALLEAGATLIAVEVDRDLAPILAEAYGPWGDRAMLQLTDVLADRHTLAPAVLGALAGRPFKLIANLPYNVASPLLVNLCMDHAAMGLAIVMVQREVADRLTAGPGGRDYGPLGILVQATCEAQRLFTLSPACFWPQPQVESAVVRLVRRAQPITPNLHRFAALVHRLFQQRRKQIGSVLGRNTPLPPGVVQQVRPEQLTLTQLAQLAAMLPPVVPGR